MNVAEAYLSTLPQFGQHGAAALKPGLARMTELLAALGNPHQRFRSIHLAGTNGKGSTASMIAAMGTASGLRVGLHTSPHMHDVRERMRIDGVMASQVWLDDIVAHWQHVFEQHQPSYFEATVALSFLYFAHHDVDLAVVETGLGGRLDATNVLHPDVSVITPIARDHVDILGHTLATIAREKAGIIKPYTPVVVAVQSPSALHVIQAMARAQQAPVHLVQETVQTTITEQALLHTTVALRTPRHFYEAIRVDLAGLHQAANASVAVRVAEVAGPSVAPQAIKEGLTNVHQLSGLRGRLTPTQTEPLVLVDAAHNVAAVKATLTHVRQHTSGRLLVAFTTLRDKDASALAELLQQYADIVIGVPFEHPRALLAEDLEAALQAAGAPLLMLATATEARDLLIEMASPSDVILGLGSHHLVAAWLEAN